MRTAFGLRTQTMKVVTKSSLADWVRLGVLIAIISFALAVGSRGFCETVYVTSTGEGTGANHKDALQEALSDAVGRINGIAIATKSRDELSELAATRNARSTVLTAQSTKKTVDTSTAGLVRSYKIIREDSDVKGLIRMTIEAEIVRYEAKESNRLRLAVLDFTSGTTNYMMLGSDIEAAMLSRRFRHGVVNDLTSVRKFAIIDREFAAGRQAEIARLVSSKVPNEDRIRLGQDLAADYMVVGKIEEFSVDEQDVKVLGGEPIKTLLARLNIPYRLVDLGSGTTVLAHAAEITLRVPVLAGDRAVEKTIAELVRIASAQVSARIMQTVYPIIVIEVGEELVLNVGGETLREGQKMKIYNLGKRLKDPYTGEFLGYEEISAGVVRITRVLPKVAYAAVMSKEVGDIKPGAICRPDSDTDSVENSKNNKTLKKEIDELFK